ncbi:hypothetical protein ANAPH2_00999 [Anaplasma phagocytophilum]|nr:hypothetical protein ANAPH2_00999 [Anaplasma phagocytophilum]
MQGAEQFLISYSMHGLALVAKKLSGHDRSRNAFLIVAIMCLVMTDDKNGPYNPV